MVALTVKFTSTLMNHLVGTSGILFNPATEGGASRAQLEGGPVVPT